MGKRRLDSTFQHHGSFPVGKRYRTKKMQVSKAIVQGVLGCSIK